MCRVWGKSVRGVRGLTSTGWDLASPLPLLERAMTMRRAFPLLCIAVLSGVAGCQQAAPLSAADQAAVRASVDSFTQRVKRADWPGAVALYSADVHFMPPNERAV